MCNKMMMCDGIRQTDQRAVDTETGSLNIVLEKRTIWKILNVTHNKKWRKCMGIEPT